MLKPNDLPLNKDGAAACKICLRAFNIIKYPTIHATEGLTYARCNCCNHWSPYEFIGTTKKRAIANWNETVLHNDPLGGFIKGSFDE